MTPTVTCRVKTHKVVVIYRYDPIYNGKSDPRKNCYTFEADALPDDAPERIQNICQWALEWIAGQEDWCQDRCKSQIVPGFTPEFKFLSATLDGRPITLEEMRRRAAGQWWW